jgi:hypothetical protein
VSILSPNDVAICIALANWGPGGPDEAAVEKWLDVALAVCTAESGRNSEAVSPTTDYGLWQINKAAHPQLFLTSADEMKMKNPVANTVAARDIYNAAGGWSPWSAYNSGAYKRHLGKGKRAYAYLQSPAGKKKYAAVKRAFEENRQLKEWGGLDDALKNELGDALDGDLPDLVPDIPGAIRDLVNNAIAGSKVVGLFMLAVVILVLGIIVLVREPANKAIKQATNVLPVGKLAKVIK